MTGPSVDGEATPPVEPVTYARWCSDRREIAERWDRWCRRGTAAGAYEDMKIISGLEIASSREVDRYYPISGGHVRVRAMGVSAHRLVQLEVFVTLRDGSRFESSSFEQYVTTQSWGPTEADPMPDSVSVADRAVVDRVVDDVRRWVSGELAELPAGVDEATARIPWTEVSR